MGAQGFAAFSRSGARGRLTAAPAGFTVRSCQRTGCRRAAESTLYECLHITEHVRY